MSIKFEQLDLCIVTFFFLFFTTSRTHVPADSVIALIDSYSDKSLYSVSQ